jgi:hemerythrin-like domain-containing protein
MTELPGSDMSPDTIADELKFHLEKQEAACAALEEIADTLPDEIDAQRCLQLAMSLVPLIHAAHRFEEDVLFNALKESVHQGGQLEQIFERLHGEHYEDESFAEEVTECLREIASGSKLNFEKAGYMMRGFFEGVRRHIAFERDHLLPMLA